MRLAAVVDAHGACGILRAAGVPHRPAADVGARLLAPGGCGPRCCGVVVCVKELAEKKQSTIAAGWRLPREARAAHCTLVKNVLHNERGPVSSLLASARECGGERGNLDECAARRVCAKPLASIAPAPATSAAQTFAASSLDRTRLASHAATPCPLRQTPDRFFGVLHRLVRSLRRSC